MSKAKTARRLSWLPGVACVLVALMGPVSTAQAEPNMCAHFIDVGQGDATLLEFSRGTILIDTGAQDANYVDGLCEYLDGLFKRRGELNRTLDAVYVTHPHSDHTMGLHKVAERFTIKHYIDNGQTTGSGRANVKWIRENARANGRNIQIREVLDNEITDPGRKHGLTDPHIDPIDGPDCDPKVVVLSGQVTENPGWPHGDFDNKNNQSLVIRVDFGEASFLFTGDLEEEALRTLIDYYSRTKPNMLDADVYHVGHHGSFNGTITELLEEVTPDYAIISVGHHDYGEDDSKRRFNTWHYGHPRKSVVQMLALVIPGYREKSRSVYVFEAACCPVRYKVRDRIYATAWDGTICMEGFANGEFKVSTSR